MGDFIPEIKYRVDTDIYTDGQIEQTLTHNAATISRWVVDTREKQIKDALIKLGWTPPEEP